MAEMVTINLPAEVVTSFKDIITSAVAEALAKMSVAAQNDARKEYISVDEAADLTNYSKHSIYQMHHQGLLPGAKKVGRRLMFQREELRKWIENGGH